MSKTIEQRWKAVGVDREEAAKALCYATHDVDWGRLEAIGMKQSEFLTQADNLLPLIEKAVRGARLTEARVWSVNHGHRYIDDVCWSCNRLRELEAGND